MNYETIVVTGPDVKAEYYEALNRLQVSNISLTKDGLTTFYVLPGSDPEAYYLFVEWLQNNSKNDWVHLKYGGKGFDLIVASNKAL